MDDGYDDKEGRHTYGMLQTCKRHYCVFKHSSRYLLCRCILCHPDASDCGNPLYLMYGIHLPATDFLACACSGVPINA